MNAADPVQRRLEPGLGPAGQQGVLGLGVGLATRAACGGLGHRPPSLRVEPSLPTRRFDHVDDRSVADRLVDPVGRRVGLVGEQAGAGRRSSRSSSGQLRDGRAGVAPPAVLPGRVDRADPRRRRTTAGVARRSGAPARPSTSQSEHPPALDPRRSTVVAGSPPRAVAPGVAAGLLVRVGHGTPSNHASARSSVGLGGGPQARPAAPRHAHRRASSNSRVCIRTVDRRRRSAGRSRRRDARAAGSAPLAPPTRLAPLVQQPGQRRRRRRRGIGSR